MTYYRCRTQAAGGYIGILLGLRSWRYTVTTSGLGKQFWCCGVLYDNGLVPVSCKAPGVDTVSESWWLASEAPVPPVTMPHTLHDIAGCTMYVCVLEARMCGIMVLEAKWLRVRFWFRPGGGGGAGNAGGGL
jgi:hypothetical protein